MAFKNKVKEPLVFDDDSLDGVLYGDNIVDPTLADCFLPIKEHMRTIREAYHAHDQTRLLSVLSVIVEEDMILHRQICDEIIDITESLIPSVPLPALSYSIESITPLLERIWALPDWNHDHIRRRSIGERLYRCYEHQYRYADARHILDSLIRLSQERGDYSDEAAYTNNLAFEYLLEKKWQDSMPLFQRAEQLFFKLGENFDRANSRANYLTCIFSFRPASELSEHEAELKDLALALSKNNNWRARKPLVLLSKIKESQNDLDAAINYMHTAIKASVGDQLKWTEIDKARLSDLIMKKQV